MYHLTWNSQTHATYHIICLDNSIGTSVNLILLNVSYSSHYLDLEAALSPPFIGVVGVFLGVYWIGVLWLVLWGVFIWAGSEIKFNLSEKMLLRKKREDHWQQTYCFANKAWKKSPNYDDTKRKFQESSTWKPWPAYFVKCTVDCRDMLSGSTNQGDWVNIHDNYARGGRRYIESRQDECTFNFNSQTSGKVMIIPDELQLLTIQLSLDTIIQ